MINIKQKLAEIEKGCGKRFIYENDKDNPIIKCGKCREKVQKTIFDKPQYILILCPICKAKKDAYQECEKIIKEEKIKMIDDEIEFLQKEVTEVIDVDLDTIHNQDYQLFFALQNHINEQNKRFIIRLSQLNKLKEELKNG